MILENVSHNPTQVAACGEVQRRVAIAVVRKKKQTSIVFAGLENGLNNGQVARANRGVQERVASL